MGTGLWSADARVLLKDLAVFSKINTFGVHKGYHQREFIVAAVFQPTRGVAGVEYFLGQHVWAEIGSVGFYKSGAEFVDECAVFIVFTKKCAELVERGRVDSQRSFAGSDGNGWVRGI